MSEYTGTMELRSLARGYYFELVRPGFLLWNYILARNMMTPSFDLLESGPSAILRKQARNRGVGSLNFPNLGLCPQVDI
jgi:hypothetical protein